MRFRPRFESRSRERLFSCAVFVRFFFCLAPCVVSQPSSSTYDLIYRIVPDMQAYSIQSGAAAAAAALVC